MSLARRPRRGGVRLVGNARPAGHAARRACSASRTSSSTGSCSLYVLAVTTVSGLLFGIAPALWSSRRLPLDALKEGGRGGSESRRIRRWGERLVIGEVALALMLSIGAGLLVRSLLRLQHVDPGFDPNGVLAAQARVAARVDTTRTRRYSRSSRAWRSGCAGIPGVQSVGGVSQLSLDELGVHQRFHGGGLARGHVRQRGRASSRDARLLQGDEDSRVVRARDHGR